MINTEQDLHILQHGTRREKYENQQSILEKYKFNIDWKKMWITDKTSQWFRKKKPPKIDSSLTEGPHKVMLENFST